MMPTVRAAILAVGLACVAPTAPPTGAQAAPLTSPVVAPAPEVDEPSLPAKVGLAGTSLGALALYLRRRAHRPGRPGRAAGPDLIATSTVVAPGRGDDDRGAPR